MHNYKGIFTPSTTQEKLSLINLNAQIIDATLYRTFVGGLQYLYFIRPDIAYSVNKVFQCTSFILLPLDCS